MEELWISLAYLEVGVEVSEDLLAWGDGGGAVELVSIVDAGDGFEEIRMRVTGLEQGRRFVRLRIARSR